VDIAQPYFEQSPCQFEIYNKSPERTSMLTLVKLRVFAINLSVESQHQKVTYP